MWYNIFSALPGGQRRDHKKKSHIGSLNVIDISAVVGRARFPSNKKRRLFINLLP